MEYNYLYDGKNFEEIKQKLYAEIQSALLEKYGENPDPIILKRIKEEWSFLKKIPSKKCGKSPQNNNSSPPSPSYMI